MTINEIRKAENMEYIEGLDVVNVGLGAVLYDTKTHQYYTPNTNATSDMTDEKIQNLIESKEVDTALKKVVTVRKDNHLFFVNSTPMPDSQS